MESTDWGNMNPDERKAYTKGKYDAIDACEKKCMEYFEINPDVEIRGRVIADMDLIHELRKLKEEG